LEVAFRRKPLIIMYQTSRFWYHLVARWIAKTPYLSLPNILAEEEIVPEFMPYFRSTAPIAEAALGLLKSAQLRTKMVADLEKVTGNLKRGASERTAAMLLEMIH